MTDRATDPATAAADTVRPVHERGSVRFGATLLASVLRAALSFATGLLIARALGVVRYGDLTFLLGSFAAMNLLLDAGSTPAFYTFLSRRQQPPVFFAFYLTWTLGVQCLGSLLILLLIPDRTIAAIWLGQSRADVLLAFCSAFAISQVWMFVTQLGEAARKTVIVQSISVVQAVLHLALVIAFWIAGALSVRSVLVLQAVEIALIALVVAPKLLKLNLREDPAVTLSSIVGAFVVYCRPLVAYSMISFAYTFADRWLLQRFGGAAQQGFFSIGQQFSAIGLLATNAVMNVFWKEVAAASERGDMDRLRSLYRLVRRAIYLVAAWTAALLIPYSREILLASVGDGYAAATLPLALMFLFSVHQSLGQLQAAFFKALGETRAYTVIGTVLLLTSIPVTYFLLAPRTEPVPGAGLGGVGLVLKMLLLQAIGVTVEALWLIRRFGVASDFGYQVVMLSGPLAVSYLIKWLLEVTTHALSLALHPLLTCVVGGSCFLIVSAAVLYAARDRVEVLQALRLPVQDVWRRISRPRISR